jgi:hypothetical protein
MMNAMNNARKNAFTRKICVLALTAVATLAPISTCAADDEVKPDARLEGYPTQVALNEGGAGMTWAFLMVLGALTCGVMFMNAKRSHLD